MGNNIFKIFMVICVCFIMGLAFIQCSDGDKFTPDPSIIVDTDGDGFLVLVMVVITALMILMQTKLMLMVMM